MARRVFKLAVSLVLSLAALTPLLELADHWDKGVVPATDTELRVTATFACAGLLLAVAVLERWMPAAVRATRCSRELSSVQEPLRRAAFGPIEPTGSPPTLPLRI